MKEYGKENQLKMLFGVIIRATYLISYGKSTGLAEAFLVELCLEYIDYLNKALKPHIT